LRLPSNLLRHHLDTLQPFQDRDHRISLRSKGCLDSTPTNTGEWRTGAHPHSTNHKESGLDHGHGRDTRAYNMSSTFSQINPQRIRSYILRLPLCTRIILILIIAFWIAGISHGFQNWASLSPEAVFAGSSMWNARKEGV
jgi:hypothetical protein